MKKLKADRRLWLTAEKDQVEEEGDGRAAFLLAGTGRTIPVAEAERLELVDVAGRIVYPDGPTAEELQKAEERAERRAALEVETIDTADAGEVEEEEASEDAPGKVLTFGGGEDSPGDSARNHEAPPEWTKRMKPAAYLKRYPDGPNAELARAVIAAQDDGADGGS